MQDHNFQLFNKWYFSHHWTKTFAGILTVSIWSVKHHNWAKPFPGILSIGIGGVEDE